MPAATAETSVLEADSQFTGNRYAGPHVHTRHRHAAPKAEYARCTQLVGGTRHSNCCPYFLRPSLIFFLSILICENLLRTTLNPLIMAVDRQAKTWENS